MKLENAKMKHSTKLISTFNTGTRKSAFSSDFRSEINYIDIDRLVPYSKQARIIFEEDELEKMAKTIKEYGIRQPLTVFRKNIDIASFEVVSGERRLRAAKLVGLKKLPCIIITDVDKAEEIALIENMQRKDLHPIELSQALSTLITKTGRGTQSELAEKLGISKSKISEILKLSELGREVQKYAMEKNVRSREHLRKLVSFSSDAERLQFLKKISPESFSVQFRKTSNLTKSVLRISLSDNEFNIQKTYLSKLSDIQKENLKKELNLVLDEIS